MSIPIREILDGGYHKVHTMARAEGEDDTLGLALRPLRPRMAAAGAGQARAKGLPNLQVALLEHAAQGEAHGRQTSEGVRWARKYRERDSNPHVPLAQGGDGTPRLPVSPSRREGSWGEGVSNRTPPRPANSLALLLSRYQENAA